MVVQGTPHHRKDPTGCPSRLDTPCATWRGDRYFRCLSRTFCLPSVIAEFRQTVLLWQSESAPGCCCWSTSSPWATGPPCLDFDWSWSKRRVPRKAAFPCPPIDYSVFHPLANLHFLQPRAKFSDLKKVWWTFDPGIWSQWSRSCHLCLDLPCIHLEWVSTVGYPYWLGRLPGSVVLVHKLSMRMPLFRWFNLNKEILECGDCFSKAGLFFERYWNVVITSLGQGSISSILDKRNLTLIRMFSCPYKVLHRLTLDNHFLVSGWTIFGKITKLPGTDGL